jgi:hypothetical protein
MTVRQTLTAPIAGALQSAFAGGLFGLFHEGGVAGDRSPGVRLPILPSSSTHRATTAAASPASGCCRTRCRSSRSAESWRCPPSGSCPRRRRRASSGRSPWWSTSPPLTRDPSAPARARSRPTWRARSIGQAGTDDVKACPAPHPLVVTSIPAGATEPLLVDRPGRGRFGSNRLGRVNTIQRTRVGVGSAHDEPDRRPL